MKKSIWMVLTLALSIAFLAVILILPTSALSVKETQYVYEDGYTNYTVQFVDYKGEVIAPGATVTFSGDDGAYTYDTQDGYVSAKLKTGAYKVSVCITESPFGKMEVPYDVPGKYIVDSDNTHLNIMLPNDYMDHIGWVNINGSEYFAPYASVGAFCEMSGGEFSYSIGDGQEIMYMILPTTEGYWYEVRLHGVENGRIEYYPYAEQIEGEAISGKNDTTVALREGNGAEYVLCVILPTNEGCVLSIDYHQMSDIRGPSDTDISKVILGIGCFEALDIEDSVVIREMLQYINAIPRGDFWIDRNTGEPYDIDGIYGSDYYMKFHTGSGEYWITWLGNCQYFTSEDEYVMQTDDPESYDALYEYLRVLYEKNKSRVYDYLSGELLYPDESDTVTPPDESDTVIPPDEGDTVISPDESDTVTPPDESDTDGNKSICGDDTGCGSTLVGVAIIPAMLAAGLVLTKKRR